MFYIFIISLIFIDLFTKLIAKNNLLVQKNLIGDFFFLKYSENTWIAFSFPITWIWLKILTIVLIWVIFWYYIKEEKYKNIKIIDLSFIFILSGALWNWIERVFNSKVIDFIGIKYFAIFNLADIFIFIWVFLYIFYLFFLNKNEQKW